MPEVGPDGLFPVNQMLSSGPNRLIENGFWV